MPKITSAEDLIGKTITAVLESRTGRDLVLAIGDEDFCVIASGLCDCDDVEIGVEMNPPNETILDVCSPSDLFSAQLISREKFDFLDAKEKQAEAERKRKYATKLLAEAEKLEART
jgi:hypothetical protein